MVDFKKIEQSSDFKELKRSKNMFIWPITVLFFCYYLAFPLMAGYAKDLMVTFVFANFTFGYLYGLTFYLVAWGLAAIYVVRAKKFDQQADKIKEKYGAKKEGA